MKTLNAALLTAVVVALLASSVTYAFVQSSQTKTTTITEVSTSIITYITTASSSTPSVVITYVRLLFQGNYYNITEFRFQTNLESQFSLVITMQNNGIAPSPSSINSVSLNPSQFSAGSGNQQICVGTSLSSCRTTTGLLTGLYSSFPIASIPQAGDCALPCTVPQNGYVEITMFITANFEGGYSGPLTVILS